MTAEASEPIDNLILSFSCPIDWNSMDGDDRERFCMQCSKTVFNISDLSKKEANEYLQKRSKTSHCVKFYLRSDGTITTDECPRILRPVRNTVFLLARVVAGIISILFYSELNSKPTIANEEAAVSSKRKSATSLFKQQIHLDIRQKMVFGQVCPTEIRDLCKLLSNLVPTSKKEEDLLNKIPEFANKSRELDLDVIQELLRLYDSTMQKDRYFLAKMIETYVYIDYPTKEITEEGLLQLEKSQLDATDLIVEEAKKQLENKNTIEAENLALYALQLGECGKYLSYNKIDYPITQHELRLILSERSLLSKKILMRESTLKHLLSILKRLKPDSAFYSPEVEKVDLTFFRKKNNDSSQPYTVRLLDEPLDPKAYKRELLNCPIVVIAESTRKNFNDPMGNSIPLREPCFEVTKIIKASDQFKKLLEQTKILQGNYSLPQLLPTPIDQIRLFNGKEFILFIKSAKIEDRRPLYLNCEFGSTIYWTEKLESDLKKMNSKHN